MNFVPESFQGYLALRSASPPDLGKSVSLPAMSLHHAYFEKVNDWSKRSLPLLFLLWRLRTFKKERTAL